MNARTQFSTREEFLAKLKRLDEIKRRTPNFDNLKKGTQAYLLRPHTPIVLRGIYGKRAKPNYTRRKDRAAREAGFAGHAAMAAWFARMAHREGLL